ncbi:MAG: MerR family transcriptional regulator [Sporolactobacillus sp.]
MADDRYTDTSSEKWDNERRFTVGELAHIVGVSVRTLQYYDQSGLLPAALSDGNRRMYGPSAIFKLQQVLFLKGLGFSLKDVRRIMQHGEATDFKRIFAEQRAILLKRIENMRHMVGTLDAVITETSSGGAVSLEKLIVILELMRQDNPYTFVVRYFKNDQVQQLVNRFTSSHQAAAFKDRADMLFQQLHRLYREHTDPLGEAGQAFAAAWWQMVTEFTGGDQDLLQSLLISGADIDNWPEEAEPVRGPIRDFLSTALDFYFKANRIEPESEADSHV